MLRSICLVVMGLCTLAHAQTLTFDSPELAGISGFRVMWDESVPLAEDGVVEVTDSVIKDKHGSGVWHPSQRKGQPGPIVFDALQRSVLVRFPGAAEAIAARVNAGATIEKVELVLPFRDTELWPQWGRDLWDPRTGGYNARRNWGVDKMYRENPPNWHAVAWALRRPWSSADESLAPTFNAFIKGAGYWSHSGAQDEASDRFPVRLGPTEVSTHRPEGRMDVTAVASDAAFGDTLGERLRVLADHGFVVRKWETYDHRYFNGVYEWATATGGRGILINTPRLEVTFSPGGGDKVSLPPAPDVAQLARHLQTTGQGGQPAARLMTEDELLAFNDKVMAKPDWMPDWQYERVRELREVGRNQRSTFDKPMFFDIFLNHHVVVNMYGTRVDKQQMPADFHTRYLAWVDLLLSRQPRGWSGFEAAKEMAQWYTYGEALPQPARDAIKTYWTAWLMPDRQTADPKLHQKPDYVDGPLIHPMADQLAGKKGTSGAVSDTYYAKTGDWRGNKSFYRSGFNYTISTQNFNTSASAGAMLGGAIIDAPIPMADGRHGFRNYPLGLWSWANGSSQEHIDHYYFSITMSGNKAVWDFGPTLYDRLLGRSVVTYNMEELTSAWHPMLKRFIAPASRTTLEHMLVASDGIQFILHTLSPEGAILDYNQQQTVLPGMKLIGHELPPEIVALQTTSQPWAAPWVSHLVEDKPLPYSAVHRTDKFWRSAYMGRNYGLASLDTPMPRIQVMAHWRASDDTVDQNHDVRLMDSRFGYNDTRFVSTGAGHLGRSGQTANLQHGRKLLQLASPFAYWNNPNGVGIPGDGKAQEINSLQASIALFNLEENPAWEFRIDGTPVTRFPAAAKQGQVITVRDGATWIGVIPLKTTDLGRDREVVIRPGEPQTWEKIQITPTMVIDSHFFRRDEPLTHGKDDFARIDAAAGGYYIEFADAGDYPDFAAFEKHMRSVAVEETLDATESRHHVKVTTGEDVMEASVLTSVPDGEKGGIGAEKFVRRVNGRSPYPAEGILRDTTTSQAGVAGRLEKDGGVLLHRPEANAFLQHEPKTDTWRAMIPTPKGSHVDLQLPGGARLRTDGRVNLFDAIVHADGRIEVWHTINPEVKRLDEKFARAVVFENFPSQPQVTLNGERAALRQIPELGERAWALLIHGYSDLPPIEQLRRGLDDPQ